MYAHRSLDRSRYKKFQYRESFNLFDGDTFFLKQANTVSSKATSNIMEFIERRSTLAKRIRDV